MLAHSVLVVAFAYDTVGAALKWRGELVEVTLAREHQSPVGHVPERRECIGAQPGEFTATREDFSTLGATVIGLSEDDVASHKSFCNKFSFNIDLLADPKKELLGALGVGQSEYKGVQYWDRSTFVVDEGGRIEVAQYNVKATGHVAKLRKELQLD